MRSFEDRSGANWTADVHTEEGPDYKGRYFFVLHDASGGEVALSDVRWNSERTARRTLETMSVAELRRRLKTARARGTTPAGV